ncbi:YneF family protein [Paenibacillus chartarius]|uniref:YneF family protein n=1 Tax=Paenibacillus chartarius TaxID=747481 RepID=A0ABV6DSF9_9BACL
MWYNYVIPIVTLIVGLVAGFFIGVYYLRRQLEAMQKDPKMLQQMAKQMGYNLNNQQMNKVQAMMKNQNTNAARGKPQRRK